MDTEEEEFNSFIASLPDPGSKDAKPGTFESKKPFEFLAKRFHAAAAAGAGASAASSAASDIEVSPGLRLLFCLVHSSCHPPQQAVSQDGYVRAVMDTDAASEIEASEQTTFRSRLVDMGTPGTDHGPQTDIETGGL
jgi:hypothetical protein